jgi:uncharacterized repeat protein (TIGR03803 family)
VKRKALTLVATALYPFSLALGTSYTLTTVGTFDGDNGATPFASVISDSLGNLYGTTEKGGADNDGTLFEIAAGSGTVNTLVTFNGSGNGAKPFGGLISDAAGNLYGTTSGGGTSNQGTVFEVAAATHILTTLATFNIGNGADPVSGLVFDSSGNLYGTTSSGGNFLDGTVFELAAGTHALSTIATFNFTNGAVPESGLVFDATGNMYGTTDRGGDFGSSGTAYEIAAGTHTLTRLAIFNGNGDGLLPVGGLVLDAAGNLYGTTSGGGDGGGNGTVFEISAGTNALSTLVNFGLDFTGGRYTYGTSPQDGLIIDSSGNLFGTNLSGGSGGDGAVFELNPQTDTLSALANFDETNGSGPFAGLFADSVGNLYGTTESGGANKDGTVFELTPVIPEPTPISLSCLTFTALLIKRRRTPKLTG